MIFIRERIPDLLRLRSVNRLQLTVGGMVLAPAKVRLPGGLTMALTTHLLFASPLVNVADHSCTT